MEDPKMCANAAKTLLRFVDWLYDVTLGETLCANTIVLAYGHATAALLHDCPTSTIRKCPILRFQSAHKCLDNVPKQLI